MLCCTSGVEKNVEVDLVDDEKKVSSIDKKKNIALFGGSFDPPHTGHEGIVRELLEMKSLEIDEVWMIPARINPLKKKNPAPGEQRVGMLKLIFEGENRVKIFDWELKRVGKSYTIDTVNYLTSTYPSYKFHFVIGTDQKMKKWFKVDEIAALVDFILIKRAGSDNEPRDVFDGVKAPRYTFHNLHFEDSSTAVREALVVGEMTKYLTLPVLEYITEHKLYVKDNEALVNLKKNVSFNKSTIAV